MGKPFDKELEKIGSTLIWANSQKVDFFCRAILSDKDTPLFVVGSGGSLSACHYAASLYQQHGTMAKAITPLELIYNLPAIKKSKVLFISASGKNTDILFAYDSAVKIEPRRLYILTMCNNSPIALRAKENSNTSVFEFNNPAGGDGFLATNSLVGIFTILNRALTIKSFQIQKTTYDPTFSTDLDVFFEKVSHTYTFHVLGSGWGQPVVYDLESKLAEAGLANVLITDWRNFGHGRHHWFAKRMINSAIIAIITPMEKKLAEKTLKILPAEIPILKIETENSESTGAIDLLIQSFYFVKKLGSIQGIDPGKPGVPSFGSKLYNLKYKSLYSSQGVAKESMKMLAISRKANISDYRSLSDSEKDYWTNAYAKYIKKLTSCVYGIIIFDFDGTICSANNRRKGLDSDTVNELHQILKHGVIIGIATGRGKSVRENLQSVIDEKYWSQLIIGYYNCSDIGSLSDNSLPDKNIKKNETLCKIYGELIHHKFVIDIKPELKPHQIVIEIDHEEQWCKVRASIIDFIIDLNLPNVQILESSHSMDIIDQTVTNKLNIIPFCTDLARKKGLSELSLCIGDKGKWPGNDYQLLSHDTSLSVDEVSSLPDSGWNLSDASVKNLESTKNYLSWINFKPKGFNLQIK